MSKFEGSISPGAEGQEPQLPKIITPYDKLPDHEPASYDFFEVEIDPEHIGCIDGRPIAPGTVETEAPHPAEEKPKKQNTKFPGGSGGLMASEAVFRGVPMDEAFVANGLSRLKKKGYAIGDHRDQLDHGSGCGFADNLDKIIERARELQEKITLAIRGVYSNDIEAFKAAGITDIEHCLQSAWAKLAPYEGKNIRIKGAALVKAIENAEGKIDILTGGHREQAAFLNLKPGVTFDAATANQKGVPAFNFDFIPFLAQAEALDMPRDFAVGIGLILYVATEIVLVEDKQNPAVPVRVHKG